MREVWIRTAQICTGNRMKENGNNHETDTEDDRPTV